MKKSLFYSFFLIVVGMLVFTSCEKEEEVARSLNGAWEGDLGITRIYKGKTVKPSKTVVVFEQEKDTRTVGYGYMVEYYDNELKEVYNHLKWDVWRRKNGNSGVEFYTTDWPELKFVLYDDFKMNDNTFSGKYTKDNQEVSFTMNRVTTKPDVSNVIYWGYNELMPTWKVTTYEGEMDITRTYNGKEYHPVSVTITFDVEPAYNKGRIGLVEGYVRENYTDAPWGNYLCDKIKSWQIDSYNYLNIITDDNTDYTIQEVTASDNELKGGIFVKTNVFTPFTLKRVSNPDWNAFPNRGIQSRLK